MPEKLIIDDTKGSRVVLLGFFTASVDDGKIYIWIVLLGHGFLMPHIFRPQREETIKGTASTIWWKKFSVTILLVFIQMFTFVPFKRQIKSMRKENGLLDITLVRYIFCYYLVSQKEVVQVT